MRDKPSIKVDKSEEFAKLALRGRKRKISDDLDFLLKWPNSISIQTIAKKVKRRYSKHTLGDIDENAVSI